MKWNAFVYDGTQYDLSHLDSFEWAYFYEAGEKRPERTYKFHISFSMHCFTRKPKDNEEVDESLWYAGSKETRVFCFDRYELSSQLPEIVKSLGDRKCFQTNHGNFFTIELTTKSGEQVEYEVFFDVTRATRRGYLNLVVESAYIRTDDYQSIQPKKRKIRLDVIAYNTQLRKR